MPWPVSQDYNEAIQDPLGSFNDPDLRVGKAAANSFGIPQPRSGNFADVYEMRCPGGARWAVKCFTREVRGLSERYAAICHYLRQTQLPFTVDSSFLKEGIRVQGRWYPILKMEWVEGQTLNEFVRQHVDKPAMLDTLLQIWVRLAVRLREAGLAHGDLQHGNVLLVPTGASSMAVKLVDYDGMFIPALARYPSGEVGHPAYQHPQRAGDSTYNDAVDRFPLLLIATALSCLKIGGRTLWDKYDNSDNLLFRESDLLRPVKSPLFYELLKLSDPVPQALVRDMLDALRGRPEATRWLDEILPAYCGAPRLTPGTVAQGKHSPTTAGAPRAKAFIGQASNGPASRAAVRSGPRRPERRRLPLWVTTGVVAAGLAATFAFWVCLYPSPTPPAPGVTPPNPVAQNTTPTDTAPLLPPTFQAVPATTPEINPPSTARPPGTPKRPAEAEPPKEPRPAPSVPPATGKEPITLPEKPPATSSPPAEEPLKLRELFTLNSPESKKLRALSTSRDGKVAFLSGDEHTMHFWDLTSGAELNAFRPADKQMYQVAALSADGQKVLMSSTLEGVSYLYLADRRSGELIQNFLGNGGPVRRISFIPGGMRAISWGDDKTIRIWNVQTGAEIRAMRGPEEPLISLQVSAGGAQALTCSMDGTASLWDLIDGRCLERFEGMPAGNKITAATLSAEGTRVLFGYADGKVNYWDISKRRSAALLLGHAAAVHTTALSPNSQYAVTASGTGEKATAFLWLLQGEKPSRIPLPSPSIAPTAIVFDPGCRRFLAGSPEGTGRVWEISGGPPLIAAKPIDPVDPESPRKPADPIASKPPKNPDEATPDKLPMKPTQPADGGNPALPEEHAVATAVQQIREGFKEDYEKARSGPPRKLLAGSLLEQARQTNDDAVRRFALYREARDLAATADLPLSLEIAEEMTRAYHLRERETKVAVLGLAGKSLDNPKTAAAYLDATLALLKQAWAEDDYGTVAPVVPAARQAVALCRNPDLQRAASPFLAQFETVRKEYESIKGALQALKGAPEDPKANQDVGSFLCFIKQDWERGLPLLAKGGDPELVPAVKQELDKPDDPADVTSLGDRWASLAKKHVKYRAAMEKRSYRWYNQALIDLGSDRERIERKVQEFSQLHPELREAWEHLDLAGSKALMVGDAYLRLPPGRNLSTKKAMAGPIEITVVCRSLKKVPRLEVLHAADTLFVWDNTEGLVVYRRPANPARGLLDNLNFVSAGKLSPNTWYTLTCQLTETGMDVGMNGAVGGRDPSKYDLSRPRTIQIRGIDDSLEIRSFVVRRIKPE
jgi:WD40 repeat protein